MVSQLKSSSHISYFIVKITSTVLRTEISEGGDEVVEELVPEVGLVKVSRMLGSRQDLRLGTAGDQTEVLGRAESQRSVQLAVHDHGRDLQTREEVPAVPGRDRGHGHPGGHLPGGLSQERDDETAAHGGTDHYRRLVRTELGYDGAEVLSPLGACHPPLGPPVSRQVDCNHSDNNITISRLVFAFTNLFPSAARVTRVSTLSTQV